jgi:hypothetical protein
MVQQQAMTGVGAAGAAYAAGGVGNTFMSEAVCECGPPIDTTPHIWLPNQSPAVFQPIDNPRNIFADQVLQTAASCSISDYRTSRMPAC